MRRCFSLIILFLLCSQAVVSQSLEDLEKQLDSLLSKRDKSEVILGMGYGDNPAYGSKNINLETPIVMKTFMSPSVTYYHKSGLNANISSYYLFNSNHNPWFEWDFSLGYDYTKNQHFLAGVSYTHYLFADSTDVPVTPITNELFTYIYYRDWWLQPGVSLDLGWGTHRDKLAGGHLSETLQGTDFNIVGTVRHPFVFIDVLKHDDAVMLTPSVGLTTGTANYFSNLKSYQYISRSPKMKMEPRPGFHPPFEFTKQTNTGFEIRALDLTVSASYMVGKFTLSPSYTLFKPFQGEDQNLMGYFTAHVAYSIK
jgi:hypothetical protein